MKPIIAFAAALFTSLVASHADLVEPGFTPLLDQDHTDGWRYLGDGEMKVVDGVATTSAHRDPKSGLYWYQKKAFGDFTLKLEFNVDKMTSNSGILVRFPDPGGDFKVAGDKGYEIDIYGEKTGTILFLPTRLRPTKPVAIRPGEWNQLEVTTTGQRYVVKINGEVVNEHVGDRALTGYIGLQTWHGDGDVHFRNVRIAEFAAPAGAPGLAAPKTVAPTAVATLSEQAPNALEWALSPLDRSTPPEIRQNLTLLRESLLDEAAKTPAASAVTYQLGQKLCDDLLATLNERDQAKVHAGYAASQADANVVVTNQALEARRNYKMSWPQYRREQDQRNELQKEKSAGASLAKQRAVVEWSDRGAQIRQTIDALYGQFRAAARKSDPAK
jgi:hypothetical protein